MENIDAAGRILSPSWPSASKATMTIKSAGGHLGRHWDTMWTLLASPIQSRTASGLPRRKPSRILLDCAWCFPHCPVENQRAQWKINAQKYHCGYCPQTGARKSQKSLSKSCRGGTNQFNENLAQSITIVKKCSLSYRKFEFFLHKVSSQIFEFTQTHAQNKKKIRFKFIF